MLLKTFFPVLLLVSAASAAMGQKPRDGDHLYKVAFAEWGGRSHGAVVMVRIKGDSIKVIQYDTKLSGNVGDVIDSGIIMRHKKTGQWIIAHNKKDADAPEAGGCSDGPAVIDFQRRIFWLC